MLWFSFAVLSALAVAGRDVSIKALFTNEKPLQIAACELFWSLPVFVAATLFTPVPEFERGFWTIFLLTLPLEIIAYLLYMYAIRVSPLTLTVPFLAFTPVFMILTGQLFLGETVNYWGGLGITAVVAGSYILHLEKGKEDWWGPIAGFLRERGSWLMFLVAVFYSLTAVLGKKAMLYSSPLYFSFLFSVAFNVLMLSGLLACGAADGRLLLRQSGKGLWFALLLLASAIFHGLGITLTEAVYMIAVKRSSILFGVLGGWLILKEENRGWRGLGSLCMFVGVLLITLLG
ncbi:MAG: DMT family transporter [Deltaproteobacteria bacterium]|nr:DMT family transporter [Deltaproteobacteria bacterium]